MFSRAGFDPVRDIAGIVLNRWGHAVRQSAARLVRRQSAADRGRAMYCAGQPFGRIAFANTDLSGNMDHRSSIIESDRAVGQLFDEVLT